ncbi:MAG: hypothetical protein OXH38_02335 [Chloroflexi bacterium]|nr:hypothetical protein [Chloroflexota bacterium]
MSPPQFARNNSQPPDSDSESGGCPESCAQAPGVSQTDALWQYLRRIESSLDQIDARIDRLYIALGGGTVLLAAIGLGSAFIVRAG